MKHLSFWEQEHFTRTIPYCILGGGIVGLFSAYFLKLKYPNADITILERGYPGYGASTKNAGFACFGSPSEILSDIDNMGVEATQHLIAERWKGLELMKSIVPMLVMDYQALGGKELYFDKDSADRCISEIDGLNDIVERATGLDSCFEIGQCEIGQDRLYRTEIRNPFEGQLNPVKLIGYLTQLVTELGVSITYNLNIVRIDRENQKLQTQLGAISYGRLLVCTNGFATELLSESLDVKTVRNQVIITEPVSEMFIRGTYHMNEGYIYFRNYKNRILLGGARDRDLETETTDKFGSNEGILAYLKNFLSEYLGLNPSLQIEHTWSGILGVGSQKTPIIEKMDDTTFVAIRMGGMGVAIGARVAKKMVELVD